MMSDMMASQPAQGRTAMDRPPSDLSGPQSLLASLSANYGLPAPQTDFLKARDGAKLRYAHWKAAPDKRRGLILYLNGRTEFIEKTIDTYAILQRSGFDIWTFDWRGQGLSNRQLDDPGKGHITDYQHYLDDLRQVVDDIMGIRSADAPTILLAHSMGGHIGLRFLHDHPGLFDQAVMSAPMIDISVNRAWLRHLNRLIIGFGFGKRYALGTGRFQPIYINPADPKDNGRLDDYKLQIARYQALSCDAEKRMRIEQMLRDDPRLCLGGPTADWLEATFRSINITWSKGYAEAIDTPTLLVGGGRDTVVETARQQEMAGRLKKGRFHLIEDGAHELLVECDDIRQGFFRAFSEFTGFDVEVPPVDLRNCIRL